MLTDGPKKHCSSLRLTIRWRPRFPSDAGAIRKAAVERAGRDLYVSGWYITGGLVFTTLAYLIGNLAPEFAAGAKGAAFSGLWIHDAVGLLVTPLALAMAY